MVSLQVRMLGKFSVSRNEQEMLGLRTGKVKELLCYLLLHRDGEHPREVLAAQLWGDCTTSLSKKYLRQTLWQLHQGLRDSECDSTSFLRADQECVRLDTGAGIEMDAERMEQAFRKTQRVPVHRLDEVTAHEVREAVALYRGELLPGWYHDWCLYHRERLQNMYVTMLDTLMDYCELHGQFAIGREFGERSLKEDSARERTYAHLMRLDYFSGDRAGALRRFQRCEAALRQELDVGPAKSTMELCEQIRSDRLQTTTRLTLPPAIVDSQNDDPVQPVLNRLQKIRSLLVRVRQRVQLDIQAVDNALSVREHNQ
jgi:DNA-binding SARP family transcriptional activator